MEKKLINVMIGGKTEQYSEGTTLFEVAKQYQSQYSYDIVLCFVDYKLCELSYKLTRDCRLRFVTTKEDAGALSYKRSATLMMLKAVYDVAGHEKVKKVMVDYSISKGYYCKIEGDVDISAEFLAEVEAKMVEICKEDISIKKKTVSTDEALELFKKYKMYDKVKLFRYRRVSKVNLYQINEFEDYFYGYMVPSTGYIKWFKLYQYDEGFVLQLPVKARPTEVPDFIPQEKLFQVLKEYNKWGEMLEVDTVGALNDQICKGNINKLILIQEALQEKKMAEIAEMIKSREEKKFIMIAGPSSSGKTTFSHRLSIQLIAHGLKPHPLALDNYFKNREETPRDGFGNYDFEVLEALDVELFNEQMNRLLKGEEVGIPTYNFTTGKREYHERDRMKLGRDDILVIEGIHGLNDKLSYSLPGDNKFKIYLSALTQLNIDEHNRVPTTDGRLIRRMVRDARTRNTSAKETIARWYSVRNGEENNIFPYQEEADVMFNSALIYELAVLKQYAEPILFEIGQEEPEYTEAKRLLKFFDYFLGIGSEEIPKNSILREFIGGSCFHV